MQLPSGRHLAISPAGPCSVHISDCCPVSEMFQQAILNDVLEFAKDHGLPAHGVAWWPGHSTHEAVLIGPIGHSRFNLDLVELIMSWVSVPLDWIDWDVESIQEHQSLDIACQPLAGA